MAPKNMSMSKALLRELKLHFHMLLVVFTTEMKLETSQHQEPTEMITKMMLKWHLCPDLLFWVNGNATGKLDTTCQLRDT